MSSGNLILGRQPLLEALKADVLIDRIFIFHSISGEIIADILALAKQKNIPISRVPNEKLNSLSRKNHQGVIALGGVIRYTDIQSVISHCYEMGKTPFFILLDGITDVRNMGAIIRSAVCCGVDAIIFSEKNAAPIFEDMVKTSAGALIHMEFCREKSINYALEVLQLNGIKIYTSDLKAQKSIEEMEMQVPLCMVLGSEDKGISSTSRAASDEQFIIPMQGSFDSFNVSVATGIICYTVMRKRNGKA